MLKFDGCSNIDFEIMITRTSEQSREVRLATPECLDMASGYTNKMKLYSETDGHTDNQTENFEITI